MLFFDAIRAIFGSRVRQPEAMEETAKPAADPRQVAACALLLEIAHADGEFSAEEREHLEHVLASHFSLEPDASRALLRLAETERSISIDHHRFTTLLRSGYDLDQKLLLAESM